MALQAVLMCGGLGTRLRPWSYVIPKPMFPIGERPILELLLERLRLHNILEVYLIIGNKGEQIEYYFKDGSRWGLQLNYIREDIPLGTAGGLNLVRDKLTGPFLMMNGDMVTHLNFKKFFMFHQQRDAEITIGTKLHEVQVPYGVVGDVDGRVTRIIEKPTYTPNINAGIYMVSLTALELLPESGRFDATQLIDAAMDAGRSVFAYPIEDYWMDIGRFEEDNRAEDHQSWAEKVEPETDEHSGEN
jgi:NDP-sugar pyrophosphorylase family protein